MIKINWPDLQLPPINLWSAPKFNGDFMAETLRDFKQRQLAQIHILKKDLGLSDEVYRAELQSIGGKRSSSELTALGRARVIKHFRSLKEIA